MSSIHLIKIQKEFITPIIEGDKQFEVRRDDRSERYKVGDWLHLLGWDSEKEEYTGTEIKQEVTFVLQGGKFGIEEGYVVMGTRNLSVKYDEKWTNVK